MTEERVTAWELGPVDLDSLIDKEALSSMGSLIDEEALGRLFNEHFIEAYEAYLADVMPDLRGNTITFYEPDLDIEARCTNTLEEIVLDQLNRHEGMDGSHGGKAEDLTLLQQTLAVLENAVAKYKTVIAKWEVSDWEAVPGGTACQSAEQAVPETTTNDAQRD
jgi:hypothetical protein